MGKRFLGVKDAALVPTKRMIEYGGHDGNATIQTFRHQWRLMKDDGMLGYYRDLIVPLQTNLLWASLCGMKIDRAATTRTQKKLNKALHRVQRNIYQANNGVEFNINAPQQKASFLYERLGLPTDEVPMGKSGEYSTARPILEQLSERYQIAVIQDLIDYSRANKLRTTYVDPGLVKWCDSTDRVHASPILSGTVTGRVTWREPPIGTIPRDRDLVLGGKAVAAHIRDQFITDQGWEITYADLSQAELVVMALVSGERKMIRAFKKGLDIHDQTARDCLGVDKDQKADKNTRTLAKAITFGLFLYGGTPQGIAARTRTPLEIIEGAGQRFKEEYQDLVAFTETVAQLAILDGKVTTPFGRIRRFAGHTDPRQQEGIGRQAQNVIPQNGAAEVNLRAINRIMARCRQYKMKARVINQVYDSIISEHPVSERRAYREIVTEELGRPVPQLDNHRFTFDLGTADSWGEAERAAEKVRPT